MSYQEDIRHLCSKVEEESAKVLELIVGVAYKNNFSDIHFDPNNTCALVRFRVDGLLIAGCKISKQKQSEIISLVKVLSKLKIDDHYTPKDSSFDFEINNISIITVRVSILHTEYGENMVMRIVGVGQVFDLDRIGFDIDSVKIIKSFVQSSSRLVVVTGSTGSGKSTTLYSLLEMVKNENKNIVTVEDPVEVKIDGVRQINISKSYGVGFGDMLRSVLRQDPDVIMVGEIRDRVTAELVLESSLTGHTVFSSLHIGNIGLFKHRLLSMGVPEYLIDAVPTLVIGQELVRVLCSDCKKKTKSNSFVPVGCELCNFSGYKGRTIIYELSTSKLSKSDSFLQKAIEGIVSFEDAITFSTKVPG